MVNQQSSAFSQIGFDFLTDIDAESLKKTDFALMLLCRVL